MRTCILSHAPSRVAWRGVHACTGEYQELQTKYKNKYRERVERQIRIVKPNASADEVTT